MFRLRKPKGGAEPAEPKKRKGLVRWLGEWVIAFAVAFAVLAPIRSAVADWYDVPSGSMEPSILPGDRIFVNKLAYGLRLPFTFTWLRRWDAPARGEVVIVHSPEGGTRLVKRVVGVEGDTLEMRDGRLQLNGTPARYDALEQKLQVVIEARERARHTFAREVIGSESHPVMWTPGVNAPRDWGPVTVPEGHVFVMGDNRDLSRDSRYFQFVHEDKVVGRAPAVALSVNPRKYNMPRLERFFMSLP